MISYRSLLLSTIVLNDYELLIHVYAFYEVKYNQTRGNESWPRKAEFNACAFKKSDDYRGYLHITVKLVNTPTEAT